MPVRKCCPGEIGQAALGAGGILNGVGGTSSAALPTSVQAVSPAKCSAF